MSIKIAVMGAGSIGTIVGALIAKSGQDVVLIDIDEKNIAALNAQGARITGFLDLVVPVKAITPLQMSGTYDIVLLTTKQTYNEVALKQLLPHLTGNSTVCTLQNGIPEESVASYVGAERTTGGTTGFGATWLGPGVSELTSTAAVVEKYAFEIGQMNGEITPTLQKLQEVLSAVGGTTPIANFMGVRWAKLLMNATFSGMSTALGCTFRGVLTNAEAMEVLAYIADETIKTAHACGYRLEEIQGVDMEFLEIKPGQSSQDKMDFYRKVWGVHDNTASMLQDLQKGRKTEIDYINGYVSSKGQQKNIPTPCNDFVVEVVKEAEAAKAVPDFATNLEKARRMLLSKGAVSKGGYTAR
jgi:2-dehydropantoate 2-reductase